MRIALYFRVSTGDQTTEPQRLELIEFCQRNGWRTIKEFSDTVSGAKWTRIGLDLLMQGIRKNRFDAVLCVKLDRLGRSLPHLCQMIAEMESHGCALIATSQGIDTRASNPAGRLQMHVLMAVAEFERELIRERTNAGLRAARARGSRLGRPKFILTDEHRAILERSETMTVRQVAAALGCSQGTAAALVREQEEKTS
jgi:putative DNA-invertase from lambdoid prophage Rac